MDLQGNETERIVALYVFSFRILWIYKIMKQPSN